MDPPTHLGEKWRDITGGGGVYEVSNLGRVKGYRGRILKGSVTGQMGYLKVTLCPPGIPRISEYIHRLVLKAFEGEPAEGAVACHGNNDPRDNRANNLRWGTQQDNIQDMVRQGRHASQQKEACPRGHPLKDPNLVVSERENGGRKCRACNIARARQQRNGKIRLQEESDNVYEKIRRGEM